MSKILIGGGTGFVGKYLQNHLKSNGYNVVVISRRPGPQTITWDDIQKNGLPSSLAVVNLAGENVLNFTKRWTDSFQQDVYKSRIKTTKILREAIDASSSKPKAFIVSSGVGIYPPSPTNKYQEDHPVEGFDYFSRLCIDWEKASCLEKSNECRVINLRTGVVLGRNGGMIDNLIIPFFLGLGGPIGSGRQILPWIHIQDLVNLIRFCIENKNAQGKINAVAPSKTTNEEFTQAFASALNRKAPLPVPEIAFKFLLGEERAVMVTKGQIVIPKKALDMGFEFKYPDIKSACSQFAHLSLDKHE